MILAVIEIQGFIKHLTVSEEILKSRRITVAVPRVLADVAYGPPPNTAEMKTIEFLMRKYDDKNHIAYFDFNKWV